ncbi:hypothetical protein [Neobacillus ginsengisoli]|uniref:Uncharacterized protein n=1 Tax=Neobacillus ginsengisoli TaxID=904295 RepID=A0ABT9XRR0_9BACI|nr:hypothetical protein [Neobacillus ginsengisoli]MDQ0198247.1 hypothetical protein [Neobacillus ginsengisoli]
MFQITVLIVDSGEFCKGRSAREKRAIIYREVGVFKNQGKLSGRFVDVMIIEKIFEDFPHPDS